MTASPFARAAALAAAADAGLARLPASLVQLVLRLAVAVPFWKSGLTKWEAPFVLSDSAVLLFSEEFRLHLFGAEIAYPAPMLMAYAAGTAEIVLPLLLVVGLASRFAALGLLVMTAIIQLTIPDGWANFHLPWAAMLAAIVAYGPGRLSLDAAAGRVLPWGHPTVASRDGAIRR